MYYINMFATDLNGGEFSWNVPCADNIKDMNAAENAAWELANTLAMRNHEYAFNFHDAVDGQLRSVCFRDIVSVALDARKSENVEIPNT